MKQLLLNAGFGGFAIAAVQTAVSVTGTPAPSTFWQAFATLALTSLMTISKWYFDDRKSSRANSEALGKLQTQIDDLRKELLDAQKPARRRTTGRLR